MLALEKIARALGADIVDILADVAASRAKPLT